MPQIPTPHRRRTTSFIISAVVLITALLATGAPADAQPAAKTRVPAASLSAANVIPGPKAIVAALDEHPATLFQGRTVQRSSDDFEDPEWDFLYGEGFANRGISVNHKWLGGMRGAPEILNVVAPPPGGPTGSTRALQVRTVDWHDDAYANQEGLIMWDQDAPENRLYPEDQPFISVNVHLPDFDNWPSGWQSFALRTAPSAADYAGTHPNAEWYYPSIWISNAYNNGGTPQIVVRSDDGDTVLGDVSQAGWWTLGIGYDEVGVAHYYASPGVDPLKPADKIYDTTQGANDARMESLLYHFISIAHHASPNVKNNWIIDNYTTTVVDHRDLAQRGPTPRN